MRIVIISGKSRVQPFSFVWFMVFMIFNATFINISVISWRSVWLMEETAEYPENTTELRQSLTTLSHNVVSSTQFELTTLVVIGTDCIKSSCKSNQHPIMTSKALFSFFLISTWENTITNFIVCKSLDYDFCVCLVKNSWSHGSKFWRA